MQHTRRYLWSRALKYSFSALLAANYQIPGKNNMKQMQQGFTLMELLIAVAIVGILASIAYPSYQDSVIKSHRADAKSALLELANFMERHATEVGCYMDLGVDNLCGTADDSAPGLPFTTTPRTGTIYYNLVLSAVTATSFTLEADPIAGSTQANDTCGSLLLTNTGVKSINYNAPEVSATDCW